MATLDRFTWVISVSMSSKPIVNCSPDFAPLASTDRMGSTGYMTSLLTLAACIQGATECNDNGSNIGALLIVGTVWLLGLVALGIFINRIRPGAQKNDKN